jgi:hypothetical protein
MLENPYYSNQPTLSGDALLYRGEGRIEESPDGSSFLIWWESTLEEAITVQLHYAKILGAGKQMNRTRWTFLLYLIVSLTAISLFFLAPDVLGEIKQGILFLGCAGALLFGLGMLNLGKQYRKSMRELVINSRGTEGIVETLFRIDPTGVHERALGTDVTYSWSNLRELEVTKANVIFYRHPPGMLNVPLRAFPDVQSLARFVALAEKYSKQRQG